MKQPCLLCHRYKRYITETSGLLIHWYTSSFSVHDILRSTRTQCFEMITGEREPCRTPCEDDTHIQYIDDASFTSLVYTSVVPVEKYNNRVFTISYSIHWTSRISLIQLQSVKHDWTPLKTFLFYPLKVVSLCRPSPWHHKWISSARQQVYTCVQVAWHCLFWRAVMTPFRHFCQNWCIEVQLRMWLHLV